MFRDDKDFTSHIVHIKPIGVFCVCYGKNTFTSHIVHIKPEYSKLGSLGHKGFTSHIVHIKLEDTAGKVNTLMLYIPHSSYKTQAPQRGSPNWDDFTSHIVHIKLMGKKPCLVIC